MIRKHPDGREAVTFMASKKLVQYLDELLETGIYGTTRAGVVRSLVHRQVEELISNGMIDRRDANAAPQD